jgi:alkanesulfonate monooxygenase SsuD/methylene tetrahydromethanopterin reductase-like flavin-dependent oxidoreductase (luciferase family)
MILTATFGSADMGADFGLSGFRSVVTTLDRVGIDAAFFVRSSGPGAPMLDAVPLIAALVSVPVGIGLGAGVPVAYSEPFHLARAFAAIDRLTRGRSAVVFDIAAGDDLAPAIGRGAPGADRYERIVELFEATTKLWDSWEDDAILVDRPAGLFTDPARIHRIDHDGAHYAVRGPLNAPRPVQGWPVIVVPVASAASRDLAARVADVVLIGGSTPDRARQTGAAIREIANSAGSRTIRILVDVVPIFGRTSLGARTAAEDALHFEGTPEQLASLMRDWHAAGICDGFNLHPPANVDLLGECVTALGRAPVTDGTTLRERFDLPRPRSRYAAA